MLLTSACCDAVLLRCLSWQVDAMLAVTVRVAVTWPGRDGLSPAVARQDGVAASTCQEQISFSQREEEICSVQVLAATPSCCTCSHGRWVRCWLPPRPRRAHGRPGQAGAPRALARQDRAAATKSISSP